MFIADTFLKNKRVKTHKKRVNNKNQNIKKP